MPRPSTLIRSSKSEGFDTVDKFRSLCEEISRLTAQENVEVVPYRTSEVLLFKALPSDRQHQVVGQIELYAEMLRQTLLSGHKLSESRQLSWNAFKILKLKPTSDFFTYMSDDSVVEIYSAQGIQMFRNLRFFQICSYTLEDIYCRPWFELYARDPKVIEVIGENVSKCLSGKQNTSFFPAIGSHSLEEKDSPFMYRLELEITCLSPVTDENGSCSNYFSAIETVDIVNQLSPAEKEDKLSKYYARTRPLSLI